MLAQNGKLTKEGKILNAVGIVILSLFLWVIWMFFFYIFGYEFWTPINFKLATGFTIASFIMMSIQRL